MGDTRRYLAPQNQETVLHETAAELLAEEGQSVPDWEIVGPQIAAEIDRQSGQLLADASTDYDAFERLRARAVHAYGRADPAVGGIAQSNAVEQRPSRSWLDPLQPRIKRQRFPSRQGGVERDVLGQITKLPAC